MLVYVAGPYTGDDLKETSENIRFARNVAAALWNQGHTVICPHSNSAHMEDEVDFDHAEWINRSLILLERCDAVVMIPGYLDSTGAMCELKYAKDFEIPIYCWDEEDGLELPLHPTEVNCPHQCRGFIQALMKMYRLHLSKNQDYSPANVLACGEIGLITRLWDKTARLMSLFGFKFDVSNPRFEGGSQPKHESIDDTLTDLANYAVIGQLLRKGLWGR